MKFRIEKLRRDHRVEEFDCGKEPLNRFLIRFALCKASFRLIWLSRMTRWSAFTHWRSGT
jgi:hypothetical protein